jgi:hypothetical protein
LGDVRVEVRVAGMAETLLDVALCSPSLATVILACDCANWTVLRPCSRRAIGRLYTGPRQPRVVRRERGKTNSSLVRFEGSAAFGIERVTAAVRIT